MADERSTLQKYAKFGAALRRQQLLAELKAIHLAFPDLRHPLGAEAALRALRSPAIPAAASQAARPASGPVRRTLTPEQRKAISARMTKTWAARRKKAAAASKKAPKAPGKNGKKTKTEKSAAAQPAAEKSE